MDSTETSRVVHCQRERYDIYIGRGADANWGNPWQIGEHGSREDVIYLYNTWLRTGEAFNNPRATPERRQWILDHLGDLKGKVLGCWCQPPMLCHGHILLKLLAEQELVTETDQP